MKIVFYYFIISFGNTIYANRVPAVENVITVKSNFKETGEKNKRGFNFDKKKNYSLVIILALPLIVLLVVLVFLYYSKKSNRPL